MAGGRADDARYAQRVNAAADLIEDGVPVPDAAQELADRFGVSVRQAHRYVDQAMAAGRRDVPETSVVFTVKLPTSLAAQVRANAARSGMTISATVAQALTEFLVPKPSRGPRG